MPLFQQAPPALPRAPEEYEQGYLDRLTGLLRAYFAQLNATQQLNVAKLNIDLDTLPTQADVANLRAGDVYRDTSASHVLKVKT